MELMELSQAARSRDGDGLSDCRVGKGSEPVSCAVVKGLCCVCDWLA